MDQEEIKKSLRHSFTSAQPDEEVKITKNQFGHTVLGDSKQHDTSIHKFEYDESGALKASFDFRELADHPELQKFQKVTVSEPEPERKVVIDTDNITKLISELDQMQDPQKDKTKLLPNGWIQIDENSIQIDQNTKISSDNSFKDCSNKNCLYALPKDAKFCLKCGTAQMSKFCTECGFSFPGMEKFCPDCGTRR